MPTFDGGRLHEGSQIFPTLEEFGKQYPKDTKRRCEFGFGVFLQVDPVLAQGQLAPQGQNLGGQRDPGRKEGPKEKKSVPDNFPQKTEAMLYVMQKIHAMNIPVITPDGNFHNSIVPKADGLFRPDNRNDIGKDRKCRQLIFFKLLNSWARWAAALSAAAATWRASSGCLRISSSS